MAIKFDDINDESLGLKLISVNFGSPEPILVKTEIPGMNGALDQSEAISGFTTYMEREFEILYTLMGDNEEDYFSKISAVKNVLHGRKRRIIMSSDPEFYYDARCIVTEKQETGAFAEITVSGTAYPYKRKIEKTVVQQTLNGEAAEITCSNLLEPVIPTIETTAPMQISFGNKTFNVQTGKHILDMVFIPGNNVLTVTGTGDIKIMYEEGSL